MLRDAKCLNVAYFKFSYTIHINLINIGEYIQGGKNIFHNLLYLLIISLHAINYYYILIGLFCILDYTSRL